ADFSRNGVTGSQFHEGAQNRGMLAQEFPELRNGFKHEFPERKFLPAQTVDEGRLVGIETIELADLHPPDQIVLRAHAAVDRSNRDLRAAAQLLQRKFGIAFFGEQRRGGIKDALERSAAAILFRFASKRGPRISCQSCHCALLLACGMPRRKISRTLTDLACRYTSSQPATRQN